jgi:hypothetical protein
MGEVQGEESGVGRAERMGKPIELAFFLSSAKKGVRTVVKCR